MNRSLPTVTLLAALAALLLVDLPTAKAYPEPNPVTTTWKLDFTWQKPRPIAIRDTEGVYRWYWYMPYKVVNKTGQEVLFLPQVHVATDTGNIIEAGRNIPASLFPKIKEQLNNPLLDSPTQAVGQLLQGEDYARESVFIWAADTEPDPAEMSVFIAGLSGDTHAIVDPDTGEKILLRRTLMLTFTLPGNAPTPQNQAVVFKDSQEVMR